MKVFHAHIASRRRSPHRRTLWSHVLGTAHLHALRRAARSRAARHRRLAALHLPRGPRRPLEGTRARRAARGGRALRSVVLELLYEAADDRAVVVNLNGRVVEIE